MKQKRRFEGKRVWLTGASSGIGLGLAKGLAKEGAHLCLTARRKEVLETLKTELETEVLTLPFDVTDKTAYANAEETIQAAWGGLDMVILNAGTCEYVSLDAFDVAVFETLMETNFLSTVYGVKMALSLMRSSKDPHLVTMSSLNAYLGLPRAEAYGATKAAISNFAQSLRLHLRPKGVTVTNVLPGFVKTPLTDRNEFDMPFLLSPEQAVSRILKGLAQKKEELYFPKRFAWPMKLISSLPSSWITRLLGNMVK